MKERAVEMVRPRVVSGPDDPTQSRDAPIQQRRPSAPDELRNQWSLKSDQAGMRASVVLDALAMDLRAQASSVHDGDRATDGFDAEVVRHYRAFQPTIGKPNIGIAQFPGVPRKTAAQWVHQARQCGHLAPANDKTKRD